MNRYDKNINKYDRIIIFILLKICRLLSKYSSFENISTQIYCIEKEFDKEVE